MQIGLDLKPGPAAESRAIDLQVLHDPLHVVARLGERDGLDPIDDVHAALRSGRTTCRELVELYLKRIAAYDKSGPGLNAVQAINPRALEEAGEEPEALEAVKMLLDLGADVNVAWPTAQIAVTPRGGGSAGW